MRIDVTGKMDFIGLWREGIKDWNGRLPERMVDDELEETFWKSYVDRKSENLPLEPYAQKVCEKLFTLINEEDHVLEIGPGWGNYTFPIADFARRVTCVESSASVLDFLKRVSKKEGYNSVNLIHAKWEQFEADEQYDVVFGMNCFYRMFDIEESLLTIDRVAKRLAVIGMTTGPVQPHYLDLYESEGYAIKFPRRDYIHLLNILYEMGIYADCQLIKLTKTYEYKTYEELLEAGRSKILDEYIDIQKLEAALDKHVVFENGKYIYEHAFHSALIYWKPGNGLGS